MGDRSQRDLLRGNLDLMVLSVLAAEPQYGYAIQKKIAEAGSGKISVQAGTLYPLLHRLESEKLIRSYWDDSTGRKRKWYELTKKGLQKLSVQQSQWDLIANCMATLLQSNKPTTEERNAKPAT